MRENNKIILIEPKILVDAKCRKCGNTPIKAVEFRNFKFFCTKCGMENYPDPRRNSFSFYLSQIMQKLFFDKLDEVLIQYKVDRMAGVEELPLYKKELMIFKTLFENTKVFKTNLEETEDEETNKSCLHCGFCMDCMTCRDCGKEGISRGEDKCVKCGSRNISKTYIQKIEKKECPYCHSKNIEHPRTDLDKCPKCNSKKLTSSIKIHIHRLTLTKIKAIRLDT